MPRKKDASKVFEHYHMTLDEVKLLEASRTDPNLFFEYWFKKPDSDRAFQLDYNFDDAGKWQVDFCLAQQTLILGVMGIGTGKTLAVGMCACFHGVLNQDFKFMNVGFELRQAQYMYEAIIEFAQGTRFEKLIAGKPKTPNPKIVIEYYVGDILRRAELNFISAGENNDAMNIFSWRGDWINVEEFGRFTNITELIANLTTRLTGATAGGRPYMGRLSCISNPHENPEMWALFDQCLADPIHSLAISIDTEKNKNVTRAQIEAQMRNMSKEDQERFLSGKRPDGRGIYFSKELIARAASPILTERLMKGIESGEPGWIMQPSAYFGTPYFQMPVQQDRIYIMMGDPGVGNPPLRNAPAIFVFDVTEYETAGFAFMVGFWWGYGYGSIQPFVDQFLHWIDYYKPIVAGVDSTATQKNMAELMNLDYIFNLNKSIDFITPMDFSGGKKHAYLICTRLSLEQGRIQYPDVAKGLSQQLARYDPIEDGPNNTKTKLAQDLVATLGMVCWKLRGLYGLLEIPGTGENGEQAVHNNLPIDPNIGGAFPRERRSPSRRGQTAIPRSSR